MAPVSKKTFLRLARLLQQALSKQIQDSPKEVESALLQTKAIMTDVLKGLPVDTNVDLFLDIQAILCELMLSGVSESKAKELLQVNRRVAEALDDEYKLGNNVDILVKVNMELSYVLIRGSEDTLFSLLILVSEGLKGWEGTQDVRSYFYLNDAITKTLCVKFEERRLDYISELNRFLADVMSRDYPDGSFFRLVQLSHIICLAISDKCENSEHIYMANLQLSEFIRSPTDAALHEDLLALNSELARILVQQNPQIKFCKLISWKQQLFNVMLKISESTEDTEEANAEDEEASEVPNGIGETSDGKERVSGLANVLQNTASVEEVVSIPDLREHANELPGPSSTSRQQDRNVQLGDAEELVGEPRAEGPTEGGRATTAMVAEVPARQPSVEEEKQGVAEEASGSLKNPRQFARSKKDFMKTIYLRPVTLGKKRAEQMKNPRPQESEDETKEP